MTALPLSLHPHTHAICIGDTPITFRKQEYKLLRFLLRHPFQVFSKGELLSRVWGYTSSLISTNTLEAHISSIRKRLRAYSISPITTVHRQGYMLE